jgi:hypothetical protein
LRLRISFFVVFLFFLMKTLPGSQNQSGLTNKVPKHCSACLLPRAGEELEEGERMGRGWHLPDMAREPSFNKHLKKSVVSWILHFGFICPCPGSAYSTIFPALPLLSRSHLSVFNLCSSYNHGMENAF